MKSMKRFFRRNKRLQSANAGAGDRRSTDEQRSKEEEPSGTTQLTPQLGPELPFPDNELHQSDRSESGNSPDASTSEKTLNKVEQVLSTSSNSKSESNHIPKIMVENSRSRYNLEDGSKEEGNQKSDTDSDDAVLPSERSVYKGVSRSFRGLDATERFEEDLLVDPDGRLGKISDAYDSIPLIEQTRLPRGGVSLETKAIGRIQVRPL